MNQQSTHKDTNKEHAFSKQIKALFDIMHRFSKSKNFIKLAIISTLITYFLREHYDIYRYYQQQEATSIEYQNLFFLNLILFASIAGIVIPGISWVLDATRTALVRFFGIESTKKMNSLFEYWRKESKEQTPWNNLLLFNKETNPIKSVEEIGKKLPNSTKCLNLRLIQHRPGVYYNEMNNAVTELRNGLANMVETGALAKLIEIVSKDCSKDCRDILNTVSAKNQDNYELYELHTIHNLEKDLIILWDENGKADMWCYLLNDAEEGKLIFYHTDDQDYIQSTTNNIIARYPKKRIHPEIGNNKNVAKSKSKIT